MRLLDLSNLALQTAGWLISSKPEPKSLVSAKTLKYVDEVRERWGVPGGAVAIVAGPEYTGKEWVTETHAFGEAAPGVKATDESLFAIASNSKLFTALAVGLLIENKTATPEGGVLGWDTKVATLLPDWQLPDAYASEHADIVDILSMRSGAPSHDVAHRADIPPLETVRNMRNLRMSAEIRQAVQYNNAHYVAAAEIVTALSGMEFTDYVQEHIFGPVGLHMTYNSTAAGGTGKRSHGYAQVGVDIAACRKNSAPPDFLDDSCRGEVRSHVWWTEGNALAEAGAGGIVSDIKNVAAWLRELLQPKVLPAALLARLASPLHILTTGVFPGAGPTSYGMAQMSRAYRGVNIVWHTGGVPGQTSIILRVPERGLGVAVLTNSGVHGPRWFLIAAVAILDDLLGLPPLGLELDQFDKSFPPRAPAVRPSNPAEPRGGLDSVPGTYTNAGYGELELIPLEEFDNKPIAKEVHAHLARTALDGAHSFIAPLPHTFVSHVVFTHYDGALFNMSGFKFIDGPDGKPVPAAADVATAIITPEGLGVYGIGGWGETVPAPVPAEEGVEETSEAWFKKQ